jgi:predicted transcriptional regulator
MVGEIDPLRDLLETRRFRRTSAEIIRDILLAAKNGAKKTHIMFRSNLNPAVMQKYIRFLMEEGLIALQDSDYVTTQKGTKFLECLNRLADLKQKIDEVQTEMGELFRKQKPHIKQEG